MNSEIERLAKEAGLRWLITTSDRDACYTVSPEQLAKFAALVAEVCAKECDEQAESHQDFKNTQAVVGCDGCADAIRAKFALRSPEDAAK